MTDKSIKISGNQYVIVPPGDNQSNILEMINDLDRRRANITTKYEDKVKSIQDTYYNHQNDDFKLAQLLDNEVQNQIQQDSLYFKAYQDNQNIKINKILTTVSDLQAMERKLYDGNMKYSSVQSFKGQTLALTPSGKDYMINVNNNCLHVDDKNNFSLKICNPNSFGQKFKIVPVYDVKTFNDIFKIMPTQEIMDQFPFNVVVSKTNNLCLMDNDGQGVSINNCTALDGQKWIGFRNQSEKCSI